MLPQNSVARAGLCAVLLIAACTGMSASVPDWLREAAQTPIPYPYLRFNAVVLLDDRTTIVSSSGEFHTTYRKVFKILHAEGRRLGYVAVSFNTETRLTYLKGWSISANNEELEVKEKDAVETSLSSYALYHDTRTKVLQLPSATPGSVIGYEYQQEGMPSVYQMIWDFQAEIPVIRARFELDLASNWSYKTWWFNHAELKPVESGASRTWEITNIAALEPEPDMPEWHALAGHMGLSLIVPTKAGTGAPDDWNGIALWHGKLTAGRSEVTPQIESKVRELTAGKTDVREKMAALAAYVQHQIRYVAIEIGIGGYQPHSASEVFSNSYGDCKDKVTLLVAMLKAAGFDSYYVPINIHRGMAAPEFPTVRSFNHVIVAIRLPAQVDRKSVDAVVDVKGIGPVLFFDPTDSFTPLGDLPPSLQANYGLLITEQGGSLVHLPLTPPGRNRLIRTANLRVEEDGNILGSVEEVRSGPRANNLRSRLLAIPSGKYQVVIEGLINRVLDNAVLTAARINGLHDLETPLGLDYSFRSLGYAQVVGDLLLIRVCPFGRTIRERLETDLRKQPVEFEYAASETDTWEIAVPAGYSADELPKPVKLEYSFGTYSSNTAVQGNSLKYTRNYVISEINIPVDRIEELRAFFRKIDEDERSYTVLKRVAGIPRATSSPAQ